MRHLLLLPAVLLDVLIAVLVEVIGWIITTVARYELWVPHTR